MWRSGCRPAPGSSARQSSGFLQAAYLNFVLVGFFFRFSAIVGGEGNCDVGRLGEPVIFGAVRHGAEERFRGSGAIHVEAKSLNDTEQTMLSALSALLPS